MHCVRMENGLNLSSRNLGQLHLTPHFSMYCVFSRRNDDDDGHHDEDDDGDDEDDDVDDHAGDHHADDDRDEDNDLWGSSFFTRKVDLS